MKIERADEHIADLAAKIRLAHETDPYRVERKPDPQTNRKRWWLRHIPVYPSNLALIAGDAAHNLRCALDHLACEAVRSNNAQVTKDTAFPVWRAARIPTAQDLVALTGGKVKGAANKFIKAVATLQPYPGGNHQFIWEVDYLDIIDKHKALLLVSASYRSLVLDMGSMMRHYFPDVDTASLKVAYRNADQASIKCPLNEGDELFSTALGFDSHDDVNFTFEVAFGEPGILQGVPITPRLAQLSQAISDLVDTLAVAI